MRASDQVLHDDLVAAGLPHLAERAKSGEWNDYFGQEALPQHALIAVLRAEVVIANATRKRLIRNVIDGKYDATQAESQEWAESDEGREVFRAFSRDIQRGGTA